MLNINNFQVEQVVICRLTPLQVELYKLFCKSTNIDNLEESDDGKAKMAASTLSSITQMKKLCNRLSSIFYFWILLYLAN